MLLSSQATTPLACRQCIVYVRPVTGLWARNEEDGWASYSATTTRAKAQLACSFTVIAPHLPNFDTREVTVGRRLEFDDVAVVSVLVAGGAGATAAGELVESLELCLDPPAAAPMMIKATAATTIPTSKGTTHRTAFLMRRPPLLLHKASASVTGSQADYKCQAESGRPFGKYGGGRTAGFRGARWRGQPPHGVAVLH